MSSGLVSASNGNFIGKTGYIGFSFPDPSVAGQTDYGWAQISESGDQATLALLGAAYDDTGAAILTGQTLAAVPEPGSLGLLAGGAGCRFHDMLLGSLLRLAGPDCTVLIVSDHGFYSDHQRPQGSPKHPSGPTISHRPYGILALNGPGIRPDERIYGAGLLDIAPTVPSLFGLPAGEDMPGRVWREAVPRRWPCRCWRPSRVNGPSSRATSWNWPNAVSCWATRSVRENCSKSCGTTRNSLPARSCCKGSLPSGRARRRRLSPTCAAPPQGREARACPPSICGSATCA